MKKIMVFDVPAESGGALTILHQYYEKAKKDKHIEWIFVLSTPELEEQENIKVLRYSWIKKSWFHRLYFDNFVAHKIVKKYQPDEILSLQNTTISKADTPQTLYLHQPLPFVDIKYKITENFKFWIYQNIISEMIYKSIKEADKVIVQTEWIKQAAINKTGSSNHKFILEAPKIHIEVNEYYNADKNKDNIFFYPAGAAHYKNHEIIVKASKILKDNEINNYKVLFTIDGDETEDIGQLCKIIQEENLPIKFIGTISINQVYEFYGRSILLFPSYIETFGLPLLEAKMHGAPILASEEPFSLEVLEGYNRVSFFDPFNSKELASMMKEFIIKDY